ncbi:hypothetical protein RRG08_005482 [Elysia crispata]|uniref:Uncharacterized protein n=1 Tax=Elysia crispata TaxID=231223 RepID=A0AAE0Y213_9GAST|nr:hypothetical protein RRG08_005482 [Elysia crispata]
MCQRAQTSIALLERRGRSKTRKGYTFSNKLINVGAGPSLNISVRRMFPPELDNKVSHCDEAFRPHFAIRSPPYIMACSTQLYINN